MTSKAATATTVPKKNYSNVFQAYVFERKKDLGKNFDEKKVSAEFEKISKAEKERLQDLVEAEEKRFKEASSGSEKRGSSSKGKTDIPEKPKKPLGTYFRYMGEVRLAYVEKNKDLPYKNVV